MEIVNTVKEGLHMDNNVYDQPDNTMRYNLNGVITNVGGKNYKWTSVKGNALSFVLIEPDEFMSYCAIRDRLFIMTLNQSDQLVKIYEVTLLNNAGTLSLRWTGDNTQLNLSFNHPIRRMFGFYENEETQRIYWTDFYNSGRVINIENLPSDNKFIEFFPIIDHIYGSLTKVSIAAGGSVLAGSLFFAWRYYTDDGYYTDWSYLSNPVIVTADSPGNYIDDYQNMQGRASDENTGNKVTVEISDIDIDYSSIQVCVFYSNDYNLYVPGSIFYEGEITNAIMSFIYSGTENIGSVIIDDLISSTIRLEKFKDFDLAKKRNVIADIVEREELDLNSFIEADISVADHHVPLDFSNYPGRMTDPSDNKSLVYITSSSEDESMNVIRRGCWHQALTNLVWYDNTPHGPGNIHNVTAGDIFYVPEDAVVADMVSGTFKFIIVTRKYIKADTTPVYETEDLDGEYCDFKSQKVSRKLRSYPQGETIRLGILFLDKTGRPFFVRHLRNTNVTYGLGDTNIPKRSPSNKMLTLSMNTGEEIYATATANLKHLVVDGIDVTDIKDKIGGFMIVRTPIIHQYEAMGILVPTKLDGNDVYSYPGLFAHVAPASTYYGCYDFYCPEDLFSFKGFAIQSDDELENIQYCKSYYPDEAVTTGFETFNGIGRQESDGPDFYNKFLVEENPGLLLNANGELNASHVIKSARKYILNDIDIPINPLDGTKLYKINCDPKNYGIGERSGYNCNHLVLMLDTGDESDPAFGKKGIADAPDSDPYALICALKRGNGNPYGGYDKSSIANSVYMSTGHYQEVNDTILAEILSGGKYIFNGIEVYGGDTFVQLFDLKRILPNHDIANQIGHSIIFPLETRMNLSMRQGNHIAKNRSWDSAYNTLGLNLKVGSTVLEEFNYNDGYSSDNINDLYVPVPFNNKLVNDRSARIRYSEEKNPGENRDSFRIFLTNNYIDLDTNKGAISNVRYKNNRIIYWQPNEVGYIPINERALTQTNIGAPVQLGVGGIFERYDQLVDKIGNSHQFGLIESPMGYHWYDSVRKIYISIKYSLEMTQESIIKGLDTFFQQNIIDDLDRSDNPFSALPEGVYGGYDPMTKMIFSTFVQQIEPLAVKYTIGIHTLLNKFIGFYKLEPSAYFMFKDHLYEATQNKQLIYIHGLGNYNTFFDLPYEAQVTVVIKENSNEAKVFDTFEIIGNDKFFTSVLYENSEQTKEETTVGYVGSDQVILIRDLKYLKKRWFGNFPKVSRERLNDGYLKVTFKINATELVELLEIKTDVRKMM